MLRFRRTNCRSFVTSPFSYTNLPRAEASRNAMPLIISHKQSMQTRVERAVGFSRTIARAARFLPRVMFRGVDKTGQARASRNAFRRRETEKTITVNSCSSIGDVHKETYFLSLKITQAHGVKIGCTMKAPLYQNKRRLEVLLLTNKNIAQSITKKCYDTLLSLKKIFFGQFVDRMIYA